MGKSSQRHRVRSEHEQFGCMGGFTSIFDFRQGRSNQRLLLDRRRGRKHADETVNGSKKHDTLTDPIETCQGTVGDGEETTVADACKPSVKKLIEEEMSHEEDTKMENYEESKHSESGRGDNRKKSQKRAKKSRKKSCDDIHVEHAADNVGSEHEVSTSLDINNIMEELNRHINQKRISCGKHEQFAELETEKSQKSSGFEEKLSEVIKFLVNQKLTDGNVQADDGTIQSSKDLLDAIRVLSSDEELFSKLLRDPNSLSVKHVLDLPDAKVKEGEAKSLAESDEHVNKKRRNFFRRRSKSQERNSLNGNDFSEASKKIVILKPGPTESPLQNPETGGSLDLPTEARLVVKPNRELSEEVSSHFFFSEIKRKLKHAIGMQQNKTSNDVISKPEHQTAARSGGVKEFPVLNSPTKDHFFIEKIARPRSSTSSIKESEKNVENETADLSKQKVSSIYIEAKKHLFEMLNNGDQDADCSTREKLKPLGRILSLPDYSSPPISPGGNREYSIVTAQTKLAASEKSEADNENKEASPVTIPCIPDDTTITEVEEENLNLIVPEKCVEEASCSIGDQMSSKDSPELVEIAEEIVEEESMVMDTFPETSTSSVSLDDIKVDVAEVSHDEKDTHCSEQTREEDESASSPPESPPHSLVTMKVEYPERITDIQDRPSPVSVLESLSDDDMSPRSNRFDETALQPIRILFEECSSSAEKQDNRAKSCVDDKELVSDYIKAVLQASGLNWEELFINSLTSDQLLDSNLLAEFEFHPNNLCHDQTLLFDCVNEVLREVCGCSPWVAFAKPLARPIPDMRNTIQDVLHGVYWYLLPIPLLQTLDQIVRKDMAKTRSWLDLRVDTETIGIEIGEAIFKDLIEDIIIGEGNGSC